MRVLSMALLALLAAAGGRAETYNLREHGRLELFPVGEWNIRTEDVGEFKILINPEKTRVNASAMFTVTTDGIENVSTPEQLAQSLTKTAERILATGPFVERKPVLKPLYIGQGFGAYTLLTDAKLVGRPSVPGDYKQICLGLIRLGPALLVRVQILTDGEETEEFQQLLGMAEGMTLRP